MGGGGVGVKIHAMTVGAYVLATLVVQGASHGALAASHYASVDFLRRDPNIALGVLAMLMQGVICSLLYARLVEVRGSTSMRALVFSWAMGLFLVSYIAFAEVAKYTVPSPAAWIAVELASGVVQFSMFGALLGLVYRRAGAP